MSYGAKVIFEFVGSKQNERRKRINFENQAVSRLINECNRN